MADVTEHLVNRAKQEYLEMPGLALTISQASRLWNLDRRVCEEVLEALIEDNFLAATARGTYVRRTGDLSTTWMSNVWAPPQPRYTD